MKGSKYLKITGFLELITGIFSIIMIQLILSDNSTEIVMFDIDVAETLWLIILIYVFAGIQIVAGILAIIFSEKPNMSTLLIILGFILLIIQITTFIRYELNLQNIVYNLIGLIIPLFYIKGAYLNRKEIKK